MGDTVNTVKQKEFPQEDDSEVILTKNLTFLGAPIGQNAWRSSYSPFFTHFQVPQK